VGLAFQPIGTVAHIPTCPGAFIVHVDSTVAGCTEDDEPDSCRGRELQHQGDAIRCWVWTLAGCDHCRNVRACPDATNRADRTRRKPQSVRSALLIASSFEEQDVGQRSPVHDERASTRRVVGLHDLDGERFAGTERRFDHRFEMVEIRVIG
jgi:hypothetical protein